MGPWPYCEPPNTSSRANDAKTVPFVVPMFRSDVVLAVEVDCSADTDFRTFSVSKPEVTIPPSSEESVNFLRSRHLCREERSYQQGAAAREASMKSRTLRLLMSPDSTKIMSQRRQFSFKEADQSADCLTPTNPFDFEKSVCEGLTPR